MRFSNQEYTTRLDKARAVLKDKDCQALLCLSPELLYYFAGYDAHTHFSVQALVFDITATPPTFVYRDVDTGLVEESCWLDDVRSYHHGEVDPIGLVASACRERLASGQRLGVCFNSHAVKGTLALALAEALIDFDLVQVDTAIESIRLQKSPAELECLHTAGEYANAGLTRALEVTRPGMTEIQLAGEIEAAMREQGSEYPAMPAWVSSGPRTRGAHKLPSRRVIESGDRVKLEFAGVHCRYHAVTMQTYWVSEPPAEPVSRIYDVASDALLAGEAAIRAGDPVARAELAAFTVLQQHGFDLRWHSRFGYGVGIAYPPTWLESLDITRESSQQFESGHSFVLHIAVKDPIEQLGLMLGGAYLLGDDGLVCTSGGALDKVVV
ncbi:MAG: hypothetical protein CMO26_09495 [Thiotrichales bacterium]|nr:hypothetical protein [Thiotrichales bacterium]